MCPACFVTLALVAATSAGGLAALAVKKVQRKTDEVTIQSQGGNDESIQSRSQ
jgi:hypothetical protein